MILFCDEEHFPSLSMQIALPILFIFLSSILIYNVALGFFGIIWYQTTKRRPEIGLRKAIGANLKDIYFQIIGEAFALSTLALVAGTLFEFLFLYHVIPIPNMSLKDFLLGYILAISFVYLLTFVCSFIPATLASRVMPAETLREE